MSWLKRFFSSSSQSSEAADLSVLKADMHSHFIPGIDDGAKTLEDSVALISGLYELGYKKVITTPHIMSDFYQNTKEKIEAGAEKVREAVKAAGIPIVLETAAEYYFDFDLERKIDSEKLMTFGDNYLLFEVSYLNAPDNLDNLIFKLQTNGYKPVLAHPERYPFWTSKFSEYEKLKDKGVLLQVNIASLSGHYSINAKKTAEKLIDKDMVDFLGTDCHHLGHIELLRRTIFENYLYKALASGKLLNSTL